MIYRTENHIISFHYMIRYCRKDTFRFIVLIDRYARYISNPTIPLSLKSSQSQIEQKMTLVERGTSQ